MDFNGATFFLMGLLVGSFLETKTTLILVTISVVITNHPLPELLGGVTPQTVVRGSLIRVGKLFRRVASESKPNNEEIQPVIPKPQYNVTKLTYVPTPSPYTTNYDSNPMIGMSAFNSLGLIRSNANSD